MRRLFALTLAMIAALTATPALAYPPGTTLDITPNPTPVNTPIVMVAQGFVPGETVSCTIDGPQMGLAVIPVGSATADASGTATINAVAPAPPGLYIGRCEGQSSGRYATDDLVVTAAPGPSVTITGSPGAPGGTVQVSLSGFCPSSPITVTMTGPQGTVNLPTVTVDANGNITFPVVAPTTPGTYSITARDTVCTSYEASNTFAVAGPLPPLGSSTTLTGLQAGFLAVLVGALMLGITRLRRHRHTLH